MEIVLLISLFCLVDPDPLSPPCLLASASYQSCADLYPIADLRCISGCYHHGGRSDRAPVLLGRPIPTSCPEVLRLNGVYSSRSLGTTTGWRGRYESSRSHHHLLCLQWWLEYQRISLCMISGLRLAPVCIVASRGEWLGDEWSLGSYR